MYNIFGIIDTHDNSEINENIETHYHSVGSMPKSYEIHTICNRLNEDHQLYLREILAYGES